MFLDKKYKRVNFTPWLFIEKHLCQSLFFNKVAVLTSQLNEVFIERVFFYHDVLITGAENKRENFKKDHRRSKSENFGANCCNIKSMCFYAHD